MGGFDTAASAYDAVADSALGQRLRARVHERVVPHIGTGTRVLDLGCGTGIDALAMARQGAAVTAVDGSAEMVEIATARLGSSGQVLRVDLNDADWIHAVSGPYDVVLANFGVLNCVPELARFGEELLTLLPAGGRFFAVPMGRLVPWELGHGIRHADRSTLARRFRREPTESTEYPGVAVSYWTASSFADQLPARFELEHAEAVGSVLPTYAQRDHVERNPRLLHRLDTIDRTVGGLAARIGAGDHLLLEFRCAPMADRQPGDAAGSESLVAPMSLVSPIDRAALNHDGDALVDRARTQSFPVVDGIAHLVHPDALDAANTFSAAYGEVRRAEGRTSPTADYYRALPYRDLSARFPDQWRQRAATFDLLRNELRGPRLSIVDAGAGNCWLAARLAADGHDVIAVDLTIDDDDGLGAHHHYDQQFRVARAPLTSLPVADGAADVVIYNAAAHYVPFGDLLDESGRVLRPGGRLVVADSPVYRSARAGDQMVAEMRRYIEGLGVEPAAHDGPGYLLASDLEAAPLSWRRLDEITWRARATRAAAGLRARREAAAMPLLVGRFT